MTKLEIWIDSDSILEISTPLDQVSATQVGHHCLRVVVANLFSAPTYLDCEPLPKPQTIHVSKHFH